MTEMLSTDTGEPADLEAAWDANVVALSPLRRRSIVLIPLEAEDDPEEVIAELDTIRARLNRATDLIQQSFDLREQLTWGVFDAVGARAAVADFRRACLVHSRSR